MRRYGRALGRWRDSRNGVVEASTGSPVGAFARHALFTRL